MRLTQGMFSFLPDLTDDEIAAQVDYFIRNGWAVSIEHTDDPHPRNTYWEMWGQPMFDLGSTRPFMTALAECREAMQSAYIRVTAFDATKGWESPRASFIAHRPTAEDGFALARTSVQGRTQRYGIRADVTDRPTAGRYR
ncbi:MAG: ribulose bisphosphate carboxylase small subunit [Acidimicrobiaceae bacterium]|nr:ribulose bisphosphate carboxylase small subunit [Acidimicrobiaceae bacterium]